jgi:hypothetical protein|tara:strand:+ start:8304 stop:8513 length:210 start_codon:yes stop_codon:yes gene_type:complete
MKFVLIMTMCSALNHSCVQPQTINFYDTWKECVMVGYKKSIEVLNEIPNDTLEDQRTYTRFACQENNLI